MPSSCTPAMTRRKAKAKALEQATQETQESLEPASQLTQQLDLGVDDEELGRQDSGVGTQPETPLVQRIEFDSDMNDSSDSEEDEDDCAPCEACHISCPNFYMFKPCGHRVCAACFSTVPKKAKMKKKCLVTGCSRKIKDIKKA